MNTNGVFAVVSPILEKFRFYVMKLSEFIGDKIKIEPSIMFNIILILISLWIASKIFAMFFTTAQGRQIQFWVLVALFFWLLKYLKI